MEGRAFTIFLNKVWGDLIMINLKSAEDMYNYCVDQCLGTGISKSWAIKHFQLLLDNLKDNEEVYCVFIGLHNYKSMTQHNNNLSLIHI